MLLAAGTASAQGATESGRRGGPPPVEPGDLLASTGQVGASLIDVDPETGAGAVRFPLGEHGPVTEIVYRTDGVLFGATGQGSSHLITVDPDTGDETLVDEHDFGALNGLEFVDETLYGAYFAPGGPVFGRGDGIPTFLVTVDQETAELIVIGEVVGFSPVRGLAYDPSSGVLYGVAPAMIDEEPVDSVLLTIDLETGASTLVGPVGYPVGALRFGPDGVLYGGTIQAQEARGGQEGILIAIDPATGAGSEVGPTGFPAISGLAFVPPPLEPAALEVDYSPLVSDGNGVFEPEEAVLMVPFWRNLSTMAVLAPAMLSNFTGPAGASDAILANGAGYEIPPGGVGSCQDLGLCYELEVLLEEGPRPVLHWDATVNEQLQIGPADFLTHTWTLHIGDSFSDVPRSSLFYLWIETLLHAKVTGGCGAGAYCPAGPNTRAQMSVFLLKALEGGSYVPPACSGVFGDVPCPSTFANWIEDLVARGITAGCGGGGFCPDAAVSRDQMAVFLLKTLEGSGYAPPACGGVFGDVPCPSLFANWIEDLVARGITAGCGGGNYCPSAAVSRDQMAVFLGKTFALTLYGP